MFWKYFKCSFCSFRYKRLMVGTCFWISKSHKTNTVNVVCRWLCPTWGTCVCWWSPRKCGTSRWRLSVSRSITPIYKDTVQTIFWEEIYISIVWVNLGKYLIQGNTFFFNCSFWINFINHLKEIILISENNNPANYGSPMFVPYCLQGKRSSWTSYKFAMRMSFFLDSCYINIIREMAK